MKAPASNRIAPLVRAQVASLIALFGPVCTGQMAADLSDQATDFLESIVEIVDFNYEVTRFQLMTNGAIIDVRNDLHLRLVDDPYNLPKVFPILAPIFSVEVIEGVIPIEEIRTYSLTHYLELRANYDKFAELPRSTDRGAVSHREFQCEKPIPLFTLGVNSNPSKVELQALCDLYGGNSVLGKKRHRLK